MQVDERRHDQHEDVVGELEQSRTLARLDETRVRLDGLVVLDPPKYGSCILLILHLNIDNILRYVYSQNHLNLDGY